MLVPQTKEVNDIRLFKFHQHGRHDVACKSSIFYTPILSSLVLILECNLPIIFFPPLHFLLAEKSFLTGAFSKPNRKPSQRVVKGLCLRLLHQLENHIIAY